MLCIFAETESTFRFVRATKIEIKDEKASDGSKSNNF